jgi:hypothetical protein
MDETEAEPVALPHPPPPRRGNLRPPWRKGQTGNPSGFNGQHGETLRLAREASPDAVRRLIELMRSDDERVAAVAANAILDRAWGRPPVAPPPKADDDLSHLTDERLQAAIRERLETLVAAGPGTSDDAP